MDRYWFLTWHTYGTWLPGSERGFVSEHRDEDGNKILHNEVGTPCDADLPGLRRFARETMKGSPIFLDLPQAERLFEQLKETAEHRGLQILGLSISPTHVHLLVGVNGDPDPEKILGDFKAYGARALNKGWGKPASETWWVQSGSKRKRKGEEAIRATLEYIRNQQGALLIWIAEESS